MGERGPAPKSLEQKKLEGTLRPGRDADRADIAPTGAPQEPVGLDDKALAVWREVVPELLKLKTLATVDGGVLEAYCRTLSLARALHDRAQKRPLVKNRWGVRVPNPAGIEARKLWPVVQSLAADLGLSYGSRARMKMPSPETKDPAKTFLFGADSGAKA